MIYPDSFERKIGFDAVREHVSRLCSCPALGQPEVDGMTFSADYEQVTRLLGETNEMVSVIASGDGFPLGGLADVGPMLGRARVEGTYISAEDFKKLRRSLEAVGAVTAFFRNSVEGEGEDARPLYPRLEAVAHDMEAFPDLLRAIDRVVGPMGDILDNASPELASIRGQLARISGTASAIMRRVMAEAVASGTLERDAQPSVRDGRLVLPVAPMNKRKIQGIVHDESATGRTVFIEPAEVVEVNNRVRALEAEERREIIRVLQALTCMIRPQIQEILYAHSVMSRLDFIHAKARYALETDAHMPTEITRAPQLDLQRAVHPVLRDSLVRQGKEVVPLEITLEAPKARILVISGPNAGGKSVCLKTVGIVQYMAQCGLLPTADENSHMGIFDDIFIDIGDDQSIENDLSTYSSHLRNMRAFLDGGRANSLALIDEFGGGTEPTIGAAIAQAILHEFNDRGMWGVITTHYQNLKQYAEDHEGLINGSMLYDRQKMQPLFRLSIGTAGSSFALEIARKTGLPANILDEAQEIVGTDYVNMDKYLLDIARDRRYWENKRMAIRQKEKKIDQTLERYEASAEELRTHRREILAEAKREAQQILDGSNAAVEGAIREIREAQAERERTLEARRRLQRQKDELRQEDHADQNPLLRKAPRPKNKPQASRKEDDVQPGEITIGSFVKLDGQGTPGQVLEIGGRQATVQFGALKATVALGRLKATMQRPASSTGRGGGGASSFLTAQTAEASRQRQLEFKREIDVRGFRADEAIQAVTYFIDDAIQFNQGQVRILHGTGTGALRQAIRQYLDTVGGVASYRDEDVRFGGAGITVVSLE